MKSTAIHKLAFILLLLVGGTITLPAQRQDTTGASSPLWNTLLRAPSNMKTEVIYDYRINRYIIRNIVGDKIIGTPLVMTSDEYMRYSFNELNSKYFKEKNRSRREDRPAKREPLQLLDRRKGNSPIEDIFGPGGVRITTNGSIELSSGIVSNRIDNPTLPERSRKRNRLDLDPKIQLDVNARVGTKINFGLSYDTEGVFDFDSRQIKLAYQGDEDEIIRNIEAGNVSMSSRNSLINGGTSLFGIKSDLQFGKLRVSTVLSQQKSESRSVNSRGATQTTPFELTADQYDENRHFLLGHYFRENYDKALAKLPYIESPVAITRIEVWITNKRGNYDQVRNVVAFADLAERNAIHNPLWSPSGSEAIPHNEANTMYRQLVSTYAAARDISRVASVLPPSVAIGRDYEKIESARLLSPSEYRLQPQLGYISLRTPLQADEVLAVAYEYRYNGKVYQVGEFSGDVGRENNGTAAYPDGALFLKLLKPVSLSPQSYTWDLMMKNIYSLGYGAYNIQKEQFALNISYLSDTTGIYLDYIPEGNIRDRLLLKVMNLDNLNMKNDPYPDGAFDFVEGYTVSTDNGRIIFPVLEPFGSHLRKEIGDDAVAERYLFQQLYDSTLTVARQFAEKNKFRISGRYRSSSNAEINLNATNVARGSVRITANGVTLNEGVDYTVDYLSGTVTILNQAILDAGTPLSVTLEDRSTFSMQRKTMMGMELSYDFSKNLTVGATLMHYYEKPLIVKTIFGDEAVKNTLWGLNSSFRKESHAFTRLLDMLPFVEATAPSQLTGNLEFAQMTPGHYRNRYTGGYSYLDDFETSTSRIDLRSPYGWSLASTPFNDTSTALFPEAALTNNIDYGKNRAHMAWFHIDGMFTHRNSSLTPSHIKNDKEQLSNHLVREIYEREIFPDKEIIYGEPPTLPVLNISFYPNERGPYNLDTEVDSNGKLLHPEKRWGGITRKMEVRDFEAANIEYVEFWLMDPFVNDKAGALQGGDLYINLGEISEDVLKDGRKFFENGLPVNGDTTAVGTSVWGRYPLRQSTVYAFDNSNGNESRRLQDVGLNGLSTEQEKSFPAYVNYLNGIIPKLSDETLQQMARDRHSPLNDPSGDNFRHYRGEELDRAGVGILDRYKYYNGTEGNSLAPDESQPYSTASRTTPDVEDIDNDNTLNENESYYQYKVELRPGMMTVGSNYIVDKREATVQLRNGKRETVNWYQFKIPLREYQSRIGNIQGFNNIRFMRIFLTGFGQPIFLRFATLELVRSEWRAYGQSLQTDGNLPGSGELEISTVSIEENGDRTPVNYVLPPGVTRIIDPAQPQLRQQNEQSISLKVSDLEPGDARAIYKNVMYDLRRYKRLQLFVHAEETVNGTPGLQDDEMSIFLRIGSDYRDNYYEYEIPLKLTPAGHYNTNIPEHQERVWDPANRFDFPLELLTSLKMRRNEERRDDGGALYRLPYYGPDPERPGNRVGVVGNPSLAEVKVMMIGIRNRTTTTESIEVWVNELRLSEFDENGGWAAQGNVSLALSDIGSVTVSGRMETAGFGALNQSLLERRNDDYSLVSVTMNMELGRFLPEPVKLSAPLHYAYSSQTVTPKYDPFNTDILLSGPDSIINLSVTRTTSRSLSLNNVKMNIRSRNPMPYDPANFSLSYGYGKSHFRSPDTEYNNTISQRLQAEYRYTPNVRPLELSKQLQLNYLPNSIRIGSRLIRNYQETQLRDLSGSLSAIPLPKGAYITFSQYFIWNRDFSVNWEMTRNLKSSFHSGTIAEIEEPYLQVNKKLNRDDYEIWKDSVVQSITSLGRPLNYEQSAEVTYTLPLQLIPALEWIGVSTAYNSRYRWERGAFIHDEKIGNVLQNDLSFTLNGRLNLTQLYSKAGLLKNGGQASGTSLGRYLAEGAMMLRSVNLNLGLRSRNDIPGFDPVVGDFFGQGNSVEGLIPGLGFAFGFDGGEDFLKRADRNRWLVKNSNNITPALYQQTENLNLEAILEPVRGLRIGLNAIYENNRRTEFQHMLDGMPETYGGSFAISTLTLGSAFEHYSAGNNYRSASFDRFLEKREVVAERLRDRYGRYMPAGRVDLNSVDVLIPAFLAAYTGEDAGKIGLTPFPDRLSAMPNWDIAWNVTQLLPILRRNFKSLILTHKYLSQYRVGSFTSFTGWVPLEEGTDLGYVHDIVTGLPVPSSPYDISAVNLIESFSPLIEARGVLENNMMLNFRINRTRSLNLNIASYQIVESSENDLLFGLGYRMPAFNRIIGFGSNSMKSGRRPKNSSRYRTEQPFNGDGGQEFSNDLILRADLSHKITEVLIRKIEDRFTQATSGLKSTAIRLSADYSLSQSVTLRAFFDKTIQLPLVSSSAYPTANTSAGMSLKFNLNQ